ncbi:hypothetical protein ES708_30823 [subsurface metagenome]
MFASNDLDAMSGGSTDPDNQLTTTGNIQEETTFRPPDPISGYQLVAFFMSQTQNVVN